MKRIILILSVAAFLALAGAAHAYDTPMTSYDSSMDVSPVSISVASDTQWQTWALGWHRAAHTQRAALLRHTDALGLSAPFAVPTMGDSWQEFGTACRARARTQKARTGRLHYKMTHPGGTSNGKRWMPLARLVGWPQSTLPRLAATIRRESSGRPSAYNGVIGCTGLLQIWPGHVSANLRSKLFDPMYNLRVGLRLWRAQGWFPWRLT